MNELSDFIEKLISEKRYDELTSEERTILQENGIDHAQYDLLKSMEGKLIADAHEGLKNISVDPAVYARLKNRLKENKKAILPDFAQRIMFLFKYRIPAYQSIIATLVVIIITWFLTQRNNFMPPNALTPMVIERADTVLIVSAPDTVIIQKIVYVQNRTTASDNEYLGYEIGIPSPGDENILVTADISFNQVGLTFRENEAIPDFFVSDN
jgi:hypothetical protein